MSDRVYRIKDATGNVVRSREFSGFYPSVKSAERAIVQLKSVYWRTPPFTIETAELDWEVVEREDK